MTIDRQTSIALLREELEQQRNRAEAAEAELRELRRVVDAWKVADAKFFDWASDKNGRWDEHDQLADAVETATEALRHA